LKERSLWCRCFRAKRRKADCQVLNNPAEKKNLISHLSSQKNITKITELIGRKDLDFEVDFPTTAELDKFLEELRLQAPYIKDFEVINILVD
jgi:hypothetical protein